MRAKPGTYALILRSRSKAKAQVGRWGQLDVVPGYYVYVGSALGPGGVRARVLRHCRKTKPKHWHIDYLPEFLRPISAWYSYDSKRLEHRWARVFSEIDGISSVRGFGCSDCRCNSHLFSTSKKPELALFSDAVRCKIEPWSLLQDAPLAPKVAKKPRTQHVATPGFNRIRCPLCRWQPKPSHRWFCAPCDYPEYFDDGCGAYWNTFATRGRCPGCCHQWRWTACLSCEGWSLHADWHAKESKRSN